MSVRLTYELIADLLDRGVSTHHVPGAQLPRQIVFEPPCSIKWMEIQHSLRLGAFSYGVSGFYFACDIGRYCSFGEQVQIGRHPHPMHWVSTSPFFYRPYPDVLDQNPPGGVTVAPDDYSSSTAPAELKTTVIQNDVWIGHEAFILPGVTIGTGAVVAARSVVTADVPPYALVAGAPAVVKRYRFPEDQVQALLESKWWEYAPWQLKGACVDDVPSFLEHVARLRLSGEPVYAPESVDLSQLG